MPIEIKVLFFGEAREIAGERSLTIPIGEDNNSISNFLKSLQAAVAGKLDGQVLIECDAGWKLAKWYKLMVNKSIIDIENADSITLSDGDEIGILPPYAGG